MGRWADLTGELEAILQLWTFPLAHKRFEKVDELDRLPRVRRIGHFFTFCQAIAMARRQGPYPQRLSS